jgi:hypothetical protein
MMDKERLPHKKKIRKIISHRKYKLQKISFKLIRIIMIIIIIIIMILLITIIIIIKIKMRTKTKELKI